MKNFMDNKITEAGLALLAKNQASKASIRFTRVELGSGYLRDDQNRATMKNLNQTEASIGKLNCTYVKNTTHIRAALSFSNNTIENFYCREIGLFAENKENFLESEILFCYGNVGDLAEFITPIDKGRVIEFSIATDNGNIVTALIGSSLAYAKPKQLAEKIEEFEKKIGELLNPQFAYFTSKDYIGTQCIPEWIPPENNPGQAPKAGYYSGNIHCEPATSSEENIEDYIQYGINDLDYHNCSDPNIGLDLQHKSTVIVRASIDVGGYNYKNSPDPYLDWLGGKVKLEVIGSSGASMAKESIFEVKAPRFNKHNDKYVRNTIVLEAVLYNQNANDRIVPLISVARLAKDSGYSVCVYGYSIVIEAYPI